MLRSLSANARVDHRGECIDSDGEVAEDICALVRESGMCADLTDCETVIAPDDGCCPICGEFGVRTCHSGTHKGGHIPCNENTLYNWGALE